MLRVRTALLGLIALMAIACCARAVRGPSEAELPAPRIDHGPTPAYAGTWIGPELRLSFVGPWVLIQPVDDDQAAPIEMRIVVERQQGDAFALRTTLAGTFEADFLRPSDWTMLVEGRELAISMGDEPLTSYQATPEAAPALVGPTMIDPEALPEHLGGADSLVCLEHAADACAALEAGGPALAGCRELHWGDCVIELRVPPADPIQRAAEDTARELRRHARALSFTRAVKRREPEQADAAAPYQRALEAAANFMTTLAEDEVPETDAVRELQAALAAQ